MFARAVVAILAITVAGCVGLSPERPDSLAAHIEYMKRAAQANQHVWQEMKTDAEQLANSDPLESDLQLGFLLTSPGQGEDNIKAGMKVLREILEGTPEMDPRLRDLIQIRLQDAETRRVLSAQLRDVKGKIDDLLSIESSMEQKKSKSETRQP